MAITIKCDEKYCYRELAVENDSWDGWKAVVVKMSSSETAFHISVAAWPIDLEKLRFADRFACPAHWRRVARQAIETLEDLFPDPPRQSIAMGDPDTAISRPPNPDDSDINF